MPDQFRSARRKDVMLLAGCSIILLLVALPVVSMMNRAWEPNALSFNLVHALMGLLGLHINIAVVFSTGVCLGWLGLFLFDRSKRIQAIILCITGLGFVFILVRFGRWTMINWLEYLEISLLGAVLGIVTGAVGVFSKRSVREFPVAAAGLYSIATLVTILSFLEAHLAYKSPINAFPQVEAPPVDAPLLISEGLILDGLSTILFIVVLANFMQYSDRKDVVLIAPTAQSETIVLTGLFDSIRNRYTGHSIDKEVATQLSNVVGAIQTGSQPDPIETKGTILRFKRPGALSRWIEIAPDESRAKHLGTPPFKRLRKRKWRGIIEILRRSAVWALTAAFPFKLSTFAADQRRLIERIDSANVVVLVAWTRDVLDEEMNYIKAYREIDDIYSDSRSKRIVIAALEPEVAFDKFEADRGIEPEITKSSFEDYLRRSAFGVRCTVVPLSSASDEATMQGSDQLLALIEQ